MKLLILFLTFFVVCAKEGYGIDSKLSFRFIQNGIDSIFGVKLV